jgi:hypothetical protein
MEEEKKLATPAGPKTGFFGNHGCKEGLFQLVW